jgi:hypothetical protein
MNSQILIRENLKNMDINNRHLMVITDHLESSLNLIKNYINEENKKYRIFFGSNFPLDKSDDRLFSIISQIIDCIENGIICVVIDLLEIYQTFYDLLNQKYYSYQDKSICRIAYGNDSKNTFIHKDFKFILVQLSDKLYQLDPPLLNRFEKHRL